MNEREFAWLEESQVLSKKLLEDAEKAYDLKERFDEEHDTGQDNAFENLESDTTVDADSNSGQVVLNVMATTGFVTGQTIIIDQHGDKEESAVISSLGSGTLVMVSNLKYTHTAVDADEVITYGDLRIRGLEAEDLKALSDQTFTQIVNFINDIAVVQRDHGRYLRRVAK